MKKIFTLCISLLMGCAALNAQTFAFVDGEGNTIENGSTLTMTNTGFMAGFGDFLIKLEGVSVKQLGTDKNFDISFTVEELPGGYFQACCLGVCTQSLTKVGDVGLLENKSVEEDGLATLSETEWINGFGTQIGVDEHNQPIFGEPIIGAVEGTCKIKISVMKVGNATPEAEIYVDFVYPNPSAGISGVETEKDNAVVGYYTIDGVELNAPQKGLNIVKRADGTTTKVLVK